MNRSIRLCACVALAVAIAGCKNMPWNKDKKESTTKTTMSETALNSAAGSAVYGEPVTLTAVVIPTSGAGTPAGNVTFADGGTSIGSAPLDNTGVAKLTVSNLGVGAHSLTATYNAPFVTANGGTAAGAEAALLAGIAAGKAYFNVHTQSVPGGEIRGFLQPFDPTPTSKSSWARVKSLYR